MTKRPFGVPNIRNMGDFKAIALDYSFWLSNGTTGALYCLNDRDIYVLLALCEYAGWWTRWYNTDDISRAEILTLQGELMEKLMSCVDVQVLVDQAKLTLSTSTQNQQVQSQALRDQLEQRYDGSPTSINPNAPTTNFGASGDRYDALCAALTAFVYQFARSQSDVLRAAQVGGLASVALVAALLIPGLNFFLLVGASIAVLLGLGTIGVSTETAIQALTDQTALNDVICYMRNTLKNQGVNQANWDACLNSYPFAVGSHAAIVADFLKSTLHDNYLTILNMLGAAYSGVLAGDALPDCPCADLVLVPGTPSFVDETIEYTGSAGGWDLYTVTACDCPITIVMNNGQQYTHGWNVTAQDGSLIEIEALSGGTVWALWLNGDNVLLNASAFNNSAPYIKIAQGCTTANVPCTIRVRRA